MWCSFISVTCLIRMCDMTHSYVWHDLFACVTWLIPTCTKTRFYTWHLPFILVTWPFHIRDMTQSYVWHDFFTHTHWCWRHTCDKYYIFILKTARHLRKRALYLRKWAILLQALLQRHWVRLQWCIALHCCSDLWLVLLQLRILPATQTTLILSQSLQNILCFRKRTLHLRKRALHLCKRAPYPRTTHLDIFPMAVLFAKEHEISAKEFFRIVTYLHNVYQRALHFRKRALCPTTTTLVFSQCPISLQKSTTFPQKTPKYTNEHLIFSKYLQKSPAFPQKSPKSINYLGILPMSVEPSRDHDKFRLEFAQTRQQNLLNAGVYIYARISA